MKIRISERTQIISVVNINIWRYMWATQKSYILKFLKNKEIKKCILLKCIGLLIKFTSKLLKKRRIGMLQLICLSFQFPFVRSNLYLIDCNNSLQEMIAFSPESSMQLHGYSLVGKVFLALRRCGTHLGVTFRFLRLLV